MGAASSITEPIGREAAEQVMGPKRWAEFAPIFDERKGGDGLVTVEAWKEEHKRAIHRSCEVFLPVLRTLEAERCSLMRKRGVTDVQERSEYELTKALSEYCGDEAEFFTKMRVTEQDANGLGFYGVQEAAQKYTQAEHELEKFIKANGPAIEDNVLQREKAELMQDKLDAEKENVPYTSWGANTPSRWRPPVAVDHGSSASGEAQASNNVEIFLPVLEQFVKDNGPAIEEQLKARGAKVALPEKEALRKLLTDNSGSEAALFTFLRVHLFGTSHIALQCAAQSAEEARGTLRLEACEDWLGCGASGTAAEATGELAENGDAANNSTPEVDHDTHRDTAEKAKEKEAFAEDDGASSRLQRATEAA